MLRFPAFTEMSSSRKALSVILSVIKTQLGKKIISTKKKKSFLFDKRHASKELKECSFPASSGEGFGERRFGTGVVHG